MFRQHISQFSGNITRIRSQTVLPVDADHSCSPTSSKAGKFGGPAIGAEIGGFVRASEPGGAASLAELGELKIRAADRNRPCLRCRKEQTPFAGRLTSALCQKLPLRMSTLCGKRAFGQTAVSANCHGNRTGDPAVAGFFFEASAAGTGHATIHAARMRPSCCKAVNQSSSPISTRFFPSLSFNTVVPVNFILRPVLAGSDPARKSLNACPVCVPPPSHRPT